jgi:catechol 2,3-dioxygenase-like lactoylglutathione lyase family enzyme
MGELTAIQHVLVMADDMDATRDFYRDALGMTVGPRPPLEFPGHWMYVGDAAVVHIADRAAYAAHLATMDASVSAEPDGGGPIDHVAFSATGYDEIAERLAAAGVHATPNEIPSIGLRQLFVLDPNGVRIEINVVGE